METRFHRYTNLAATIHLLQTKTITLLNPETWDDRNDAYFMAEYKRLMKAKTVLALCFAEGSETYHHWRVFASGTDGVRITFWKEKLLSTFEGDLRIKKDYVKYKLIKDVNKKDLHVEELPFMKRAPYQHEDEYRVLYVDRDDSEEYVEDVIEIGWIDRITCSPWMPRAFTRSVSKTLRSIEGCSRLRISHSNLIDTDSWKKLTKRVRDR